MKFALSAALLASVAVALPTGTLPIPSGVVPSGLPTGLPTGVPSTLPAPGVGGAEKQVMTITNEANENVPVALENNELTSVLSKSGLLTSEPTGQVVNMADSVQELGADPSKGLIAVKMEGQYALVQVTGAVKSLVQQLSSLPMLGQALGTVTSTGESSLPIKRDALNNVVMQVKDTANNKLIPFNLDQGVADKLSSVGNIGELQQGPVGTVMKTVKVEDVQSTVQNLDVDPTQVMSIATPDRAQMMLVKVEDKASGATGLLGGLLSTLGLTPITQAVGTVSQSAPIPL